MGIFSGITNIGSGISQMIQARTEAANIKAKAQMQERMYELNSEIAEMQADEAIRIGDEQARQIKLQNRQVIGSQRVNLAAQGIEIDSGSALQIQEDTAVLGELDALTIRHNAAKQAMGYEMEASQASLNGTLSRLSGDLSAGTTLTRGYSQAIGSAANAATSFSGYNKSIMYNSFRGSGSQPKTTTASRFGANEVGVYNYPRNQNLTRTS